MKQTIEEAAKYYADNFAEKARWRTEGDFIIGAKSQAAKDFHTQGMYSEEDIIEILSEFFREMSHEGEYLYINGWFEEYKKKKEGK